MGNGGTEPHPIVRVRTCCLRGVLHLPRIAALGALKVLSDEDLGEFLDKLNRDFFEQTLAREILALKIAIMQKTCGATNHRAVTEFLRKL
ncbi:hypothetical protein Trydic_g6324 [Trypoxylus dichotomus]